MCEQNQVENWLTIEKTCFEVTNTLFIFNYCPTLKDARGRTSHLVSLSLNGQAQWHQFVGADLADHQHHKAFPG